MSKKEKIGIGFIVIALVILSILSISFSKEKLVEEIEINSLPQETSLDQVVPATYTQEKEKALPKYSKQAFLEIEDKKYEGELFTGDSVYDFMDRLRAKKVFDFQEKTYTGLGKFIDEINGIKGNGDKFWIYYVNNEKAKIGISNYKLNPGDVVSWKYENDLINNR